MKEYKDFPLPPKDKKGFPWTEETPHSVYKKNIEYPKITIITPSYNQGQFLEETIRSVLLQNYPNLEYIIIDGGSTDNSVKIIEKYEKWIDYWVSEPDKGQAYAINKGLKIATGEVINWLNSDDWYLPNVLEIIGREFRKKNTLKVVSGASLMIKNNIITKHFSTHISQCKEETIAKLDISQPSTFFKNEIIKKGVTTSIDYMFDAALWTSFLLYSNSDELKQINTPIVYYRLHESSKTVADALNFQRDRLILLQSLQLLFQLNLKISKPSNNDKIISNQIIDYWKQNNSFSKINKKKLRTNIYCSYLELYLSIQDYDSARKIVIYIWKNYLTKPQMIIKIILLLFPTKFNHYIRKYKK